MESDIPARTKAGLLVTGHDYYWKQFPDLKDRGTAMTKRLARILGGMCNIEVSELIDTPQKAKQQARGFASRRSRSCSCFLSGTRRA